MKFEEWEKEHCKYCPYANLCHENAEPLCAEGQEVWCDNVEEKEYNKAIAKIVEENECPWYVAEELYEKDHQIAVLEKALELACKNSAFEDTCDYCEYKNYAKSGECPCYCETEQEFEYKQAIRYFKQQAEKELKDE